MRIAVLVLFAALGTGCVKKNNLPAAEIPKLTKLADVMDVQATIADPQLKKAGQASYSDADWTDFADAGARLQVTSFKIKEFSKGPEFNVLADQLNAKAKALYDASQSKNALAASAALTEMKETCRTCHKKFK